MQIIPVSLIKLNKIILKKSILNKKKIYQQLAKIFRKLFPKYSNIEHYFFKIIFIKFYYKKLFLNNLKFLYNFKKKIIIILKLKNYIIFNQNF